MEVVEVAVVAMLNAELPTTANRSRNPRSAMEDAVNFMVDENECRQFVVVQPLKRSRGDARQ